jgi:acyl carrier protein
MVMREEEALELVRNAIEAIRPGSAAQIDTTTDLAEFDQLDSLHLMEFLFELENQLGRKIAAIGEDYADFRVASLIAILKDA